MKYKSEIQKQKVGQKTANNKATVNEKFESGKIKIAKTKKKFKCNVDAFNAIAW